MNKKKFLVEISETYTVHVLVKAESMDGAYVVADELVNDDVVDPVKLALKSGEYSRNCRVLKQIKNGEALPENVESVG